MVMSKKRIRIKYVLACCLLIFCFMAIFKQAIQYAAEGNPISKEIFLDTISPDDTAPEVEMGDGFVTVRSKQADVPDENGVSTGIEQIEYGYKLTGSADDYTWQSSAYIYGLTLEQSYDFVTRAIDYAQNMTNSTATTAVVRKNTTPQFRVDRIINISTYNTLAIKESDRIQIRLKVVTSELASTNLTVDDITVRVGNTEITPTTKKLSSVITTSDGAMWDLTLSGVTGNGNLILDIPEGVAVSNLSENNKNTTLDTGVIVDNIVPSDYSVVINGGAESTNNKNVKLSLSATGAESILMNNTGLVPSENDTGWVEYLDTKYHELIGSAGVNTVYVWFKDAAGNIVGPATDTIEVTTTIDGPIQTEIFFDDMAPDTTAPEITRSNNIIKVFCRQEDVYKNGVKSGIVKILYGYRAVGDTEYIWGESSEITTINTTNQYEFVTKAIDAAGNESISEITSVLIEENTTPIFKLDKIYNISTNNPSYIKSSDRIQLSISAESLDYLSNSLTVNDIVIKVGGVEVNPTIKTLSEGFELDGKVKWSMTLSGISGNGLLTLTIPENKVLNSKYEGNIETNLTTTSVVDNVLPTNCSMIINNGDSETSDKNVLLTISAEGADHIYINNTGITPLANDSGWVEYLTNKYHTLIGSVGTNTAYIWFKDLAGNIVGPISDTIEITQSVETIQASIFYDDQAPDTTAPNVSSSNGITTIICMQKDIYKDSVKSGVTTIEYGYRIHGTTEFTWITESETDAINETNEYDFVTKAYDAAGNSSISEITTISIQKNTTPVITFDKIYNISTYNPVYIKASDRIQVIFKAETLAYQMNTLTAEDIIIQVGGQVVEPTIKVLSDPIETETGARWRMTLSGITGNGLLTLTIPENEVVDKSFEGNIETILNTGAVVDNVLPTNCSVMINEGATETNNKNVVLSITAEGADYIYLNNTGVAPSESDPAWIEYLTSKSHTLIGNIGINTVYVWFKDLSGNIVGPITDTIEVTQNIGTIQSSIFYDDQVPDTTAPAVSSSNGITKIICMQKDIYKDSVKSGVTTIEYGYRIHGTTDFTWITESETDAIIETNEYDFVTKAYDAAGNSSISEITTISIQKNTTPVITFDKIYNISTYNPAYIKASDRIQIIFRAKTLAYKTNNLTVDDIIIHVGGQVVEPTLKTLTEPIQTSDGLKWTLTLSGVPENGLLTLTIPENKIVDTSYEGNIETILNTGSVVDNIAPSDYSVVINNGDEETVVNNVSLLITATGADYMYISNETAAPGEKNENWGEYVRDRYHSLIGENGTNSVYVWFKDLAGNIAGYATDSINVVNLSGQPIQNSIFLDDAAPDTTAPSISSMNRSVKITSNQKDVNKDGVKSGVIKIRYGYKVTGSSDAYTWQTSDIIENIEGDLSYDFVTEATDYAGNSSVSEVSSLFVEKDTTPIFMLDYKKNISTNNSLYAKASDIVVFKFSVNSSRYYKSSLTIDDLIIRVGGEEITDVEKNLFSLEENGNGQIWQLSLRNITGNGELLIEIPENIALDMDANGNVTTILEPKITVDNIKPGPNSVNISNGAAQTILQNVLTNISSGGAKYMHLSNETTEPTEFSDVWVEYTNSKYHALTSGYGTKTVYAWFKDEAGNISEMVSDSIEYIANTGAIQSEIFLDTLPPTTDAPEILLSTNAIILCHQEDQFADGGYKSGIVKIEYGYRVSGSTDEYTWQDSNLLRSVPAVDYYEFVTRATDAAGNVSTSNPTVEYVDITDIYVDVIFDPVNGNVSPMVQTYIYGETYQNLPIADLIDHEFVQWNTEKDGSGTKIEDGMELISSYTHTLYAQFVEGKPIITMWNIPAMGSSENNTSGTTIKLPIPSSSTNKYTVYWGDGTFEQYTTESFPEHTYTNATETEYEIKVMGKVEKFGYTGTEKPTESNDYQDYKTFVDYVVEIVQWGEVKAAQYGFAWCENLSRALPEPTENTFRYATNAENIFYQCTNLSGAIPTAMFDNGTKITSFAGAFTGCSSLSGTIPASIFTDATLATSFKETFLGCSGLEGTIDANLFASNVEVTTFNQTFSGCSKLNGAISENLFKTTTKVTDFESTFANCSGLNGAIPATLFSSTAGVTTFANTFANCSGLNGTIPATLFSSNSGVTTFENTFANCSGLKETIPATLFASNPNVTTFENTFANCSGLTGTIPAELFANNTQVTTFAHTFDGCSTLTGVITKELFENNTNAKNFEATFKNCAGIDAAEIYLNTDIVTNVDSLFEGCSSLESIFFADTFKELTANNLFKDCTALRAIILWNYATDAVSVTELNDITTIALPTQTIIYVPDLQVEEIFEVVWADKFGTETIVDDLTNEESIINKVINRVEPILALLGNNPDYVGKDETYVDPGYTVAGFGLDEVAKYEIYGYSVELQTLPIDTSSAGTKLLNYIISKDGTKGMALIRRIIVREISFTNLEVIMSPTIFEYDGTEHKPETLEVKLGNVQLFEGVDYSVEYTNNKNAGTGKITINSMGIYRDSWSGDLIITPRKLIVTPESGVFKFAGQEEPKLNFTLNNLVNGEEPIITGELMREKAGTEEGELEGDYLITIGSVVFSDNGDFLVNNYEVEVMPETMKVIGKEASKKLFITKWEVKAGETVQLPIPSNEFNDYMITWGDRTQDKYTIEEFPTHTYETAGEYEINLYGTCKNYGYIGETAPSENNIYSNYYNFTQNLIAIKQWGDIGAETFGFAYCINLAEALPKTTGFSKLTTVENMFNNCTSLPGPIPENFTSDAYNIVSAKNMFNNCTSLTESIPWDLFYQKEKIKTFENTFNNCSKLTGAIPEELFASAQNATTYQRTFKDCSNITGTLPAELFAESIRVENFSETFANCIGLTSDYAKSSSDQTDLNNIGYKEVIPIDFFLYNYKVRNYYRMFYNCTGLTGNVVKDLLTSNQVLSRISNEETSYSDYRGMFEGCTGIEKVSLSLLMLGKDMFKGCTGIQEIELRDTYEIGSGAFYGCNQLQNIYIDENFFRVIGTDAFEYTGTDPVLLLTKVNRSNENLVAYDWLSDNRIVDVDAPKGTVEIVTEKYPFTKTQDVELKLTVTDNYSISEKCEMAIVNEDQYEAGVTYEDLLWIPFRTEITWELTPQDDAKTVYVYFKDEAGNVCEALDYLDGKIKILPNTGTFLNNKEVEVSLVSAFAGNNRQKTYHFRKEISQYRSGDTIDYKEYTNPIVINEEGDTYVSARLIETTTGVIVDEITQKISIDTRNPEAVTYSVPRGTLSNNIYYGQYYGEGNSNNGVLIRVEEGIDYNALGEESYGISEIIYTLVKDGEKIIENGNLKANDTIYLEEVGVYAIVIHAVDMHGNRSESVTIQAEVTE